jgi:hypothetical protein
VLDTATILKIWLIGGLPCVLVCAQQPPNATPSNLQLDSIVAKMQQAQSNSAPTTPYQVIRDYRLFSQKSPFNASSEVWAEVDYLPPDQKTFAIQKRVGSNRGEEVVRRILQHESQMATQSSTGTALNNGNYSFGYLGEETLSGSPCYLLSLNPKRKGTDLIRGKAWVDKRSFLVRRIEGQMAENPSWILKRVDLKLEFADLGGAWVQSGMEAVAEVRFLGAQTLKSETIDARVGNLVAQKTAPAVSAKNRKSRTSRASATIMVPLDHQ